MFLQTSPLAVLFKRFLTCACLLVLHFFKMDSGYKSEVEASSRDGEVTKSFIMLYETLHSFGHPSVKHE